MNKNIRLNELSILYAENEDEIRKSTAKTLSYLCNKIYIAEDGAEAYSLYKTHSPDIVLLDIQMPQLNGIEVAKEIRRTDSTTPIVMLTAFSEQKYLLEATTLHLEGYLLKPFKLDALLESLERCLSQVKKGSSKPTEIREGLLYDPSNMTIHKDGKTVGLSSKEAQLLKLLLKNRAKIVHKDDINSYIWDYNMTEEGYRSLVKKLRDKVGKDTVITVAGVGLKIESSN